MLTSTAWWMRSRTCGRASRRGASPEALPMFRDHSLVPAEAIRLAALGLLAEAPRRYADLAAEVRFLTSRIAGPSPELMGTSLELLRYEGLVSPMNGANADSELTLSSNGRTALEDLLRANLRAPSTDLGKLG